MTQVIEGARDAVKGFFYAYAVEKSVGNTLSFLTEDIRWTSSGSVPPAQGKGQVREVLEAEFAVDQTPFNVEYKTESTRRCGADTAEAFFEIELNKRTADGERISLSVQLSCICRLEGFLYKICSIQTLAADNLEEEKKQSSVRRAEIAFSELQDHFHERSMEFLQQSIPGGIIGCYMEPGFPLYFINDRMLAYLGYETQEDLVFETDGFVSRCIYPDDLPYVESTIDDRLKDGDEYEVRYRMMKRDKNVIWVAERGRKTVDDAGQRVIIRVLFDITQTVVLEREKAAKEMSLFTASKEIQNLYHAQVNGAAKLICDEGLTILYANPFFYEMLGYTEESFHEAARGKLRRVIQHEDLRALSKELNEARAGERVSRQCRMLTQAQKWLWVQMEAVPAVEPDEEKPVLYCTFVNAEELRLRDQEHQRQQYFLSLISSSIAGGTLITYVDDKRTFAYVGDDLRRCLGYSLQEFQEVTQNAFLNLLLPEDTVESEKSMKRQLARGDYYELEYRLRKKDGTAAWFLEKGNRIVGEDSVAVVICVLLDITERKKSQEQQQQKNRIDPLTGLLNQDYTRQSMRIYLEHMPEKQEAALLLIDVDELRKINNVYGHLQGDRVLIQIAEILEELFGEKGIVGRVGSDEFAVLLKVVENREAVEEEIRALQSHIRQAFENQFSSCGVSVTVGAALSNPEIKLSLKDMFKTADSALYEAQFRGSESFRIMRKEDIASGWGIGEASGLPESEQEEESYIRLPFLTLMGKRQLIPAAVAGALLLSGAAGVLWYTYKLDIEAFYCAGGLFGLCVAFLAVSAWTVWRFHRKFSTALNYMVAQYRQLSRERKNTEGDGLKGERDMEILAEAIHSYKQRVEQASYIDTLLKIGNRSKCIKDMEKLIERSDVQRFSLFLLDIHEFSKYNDIFSIRVGDEIIKEVRARLGKIFLEDLYRIDGDVFLGVMVGRKDDRETLSRIQQELEEVISIDSIEIKLRYNLGISHYPTHGEQAEELIEHAQSALNYAKKQLKANAVIYSESITGILRREGEILSLLRRRIAENMLEVWYQPIYDVKSGKFTTAEALLRLRDDKGSFIAPYHAILVAEKNDAIGEIGEYVLRAACHTMKELKAEAAELENIQVNLSVQQIAQPGFAERTLELIQQSGCSPQHLGVEITETALIQSFDSTVDILMKLKAAGVEIALDDFGSGYSSINYLARLPIDKLKLDRELVLQVTDSPEQLEFIQTVVHMAKIKNMKVIAEGVEDEITLEKIISCGSDYIQGYYFSKPLQKDEFIEFIRSHEQEKESSADENEKE